MGLYIAQAKETSELVDATNACFQSTSAGDEEGEFTSHLHVWRCLEHNVASVPLRNAAYL